MDTVVLITPTHCRNCTLRLLSDQAPKQYASEAEQQYWFSFAKTMDLSGPPQKSFPTPPGACWHDLTLRFRDGHSLVAKLGKIVERYTFQDMGMMDNRRLLPNAQWELLRKFGDEMGIFTWDSNHASVRNQKRKERLAQRLKQFFRLPEEPIAYCKKTGGWETIFSIQSE